MSLLNLKKSKPSARPSLRSVEAFIDDALLYAQGKSKGTQKTNANNPNVTSQNVNLEKTRHDTTSSIDKVVPIKKPQRTQGMRHATFTLTPECIEKLSVLSAQTGKAKSALIREWIQEHAGLHNQD
jgi:hypothetical protein